MFVLLFFLTSLFSLLWQSLDVPKSKVNALGRHKHVHVEIVRKLDLLPVEDGILNSVAETFACFLFLRFVFPLRLLYLKIKLSLLFLTCEKDSRRLDQLQDRVQLFASVS